MRFITTLAWAILVLVAVIAATQNLVPVSVRWLWLQSVPLSLGLWMTASVLTGIVVANLGLSLWLWGRRR